MRNKRIFRSTVALNIRLNFRLLHRIPSSVRKELYVKGKDLVDLRCVHLAGKVIMYQLMQVERTMNLCTVNSQEADVTSKILYFGFGRSGFTNLTAKHECFALERITNMTANISSRA